MAKLRHKYKDDPEAFAEEIVRTHLPRPEGRSHPEYRGAPNEKLDADFSVQEIRTVLQLLKTNSAPGPDRITNKILRNLNDDAIEKLCEYIKADLSETSLTKLPTRGLESLEVLELRDAPALREFPSVYHFRFIRVAHLTYPYHCCAFQFPETHDPEEHSRRVYYPRLRKTASGHSAELSRVFQKHCNSDDKASMNRHQNRPPAVGEEHDFQLLERFFVVQLSTTQTTTPPSRRFVRHVFSEFGTIHVSAECTTTTVCHKLVKCCTSVIPTPAFCASQVTCGKLASRRVQCLPAPDAFNPCEDVMGTMVLRVAVWFVVVAAVFGNLAVLLVLLSGRLTVSKFLMCNLAFADLCMGAYLLVIASEDLHTRGRYFSHAILWQHGAGCKVAGFLTVFASELSIYTLTVITLERWYAITYAVHLNRRLRLRTAARIMACGWGYALLAASLPLLGISSYSKTSICLPMENSTVPDLLYLLTLLSMNGLAFLLICACYAKMYLAISGQRPRSHCGNKDTSVAKRMAMLVFTDFACWAPIAFFGLTAVAGYPLIDVPKSKILLVFFYPLNSCANPFLYAILTKQYRRDLSALLSTRGVCTRRMLKYTSSWHTTPTNRLLRNKDNSSTSRQTTELSNRTQKGSPHPIKNNFTKLGLHEEFLRRQSLLCEHLDTPI
ncbi:leucine-rich repeat-containing G protein-coupled receptor 1 [Dermacentor variabilis]|uniref:leucine-rich repeat-containing G protein-coupled receptor 1 n=1 Tax=Dermacentor variabilis TaxID=34621 RepID=UPI003F5C56EE